MKMKIYCLESWRKLRLLHTILVYNLWVRSTNHIYSRVMHGRRKVKLKTKNRLTIQFKTKNNHITAYGDGTKIYSIEDNFKQ